MAMPVSGVVCLRFPCSFALGIVEQTVHRKRSGAYGEGVAFDPRASAASLSQGPDRDAEHLADFLGSAPALLPFRLLEPPEVVWHSMIATCFLHETHRVGQCTPDRGVTLVGHAPEAEGAWWAPANGLRMHDHHVHGRRNRRGIPVSSHCQVVADDHDIRAGRLGSLCRRIVGHGSVNHFLARCFRRSNFLNGAFLFQLPSMRFTIPNRCVGA